MILKTKIEEIEYDITIYTGIIKKVEKWNSTNTTTSTNVTGGGGNIKTTWDGRVVGKIDETKVNTTHTTKSILNTRLYFEDGASITLDDCDFLTTEGNQIDILLYSIGENTYPMKIKDGLTGFDKLLMSFSTFTTEILELKETNLKFNIISSIISAGIMTGIYFLLQSWGWWKFFIYAAEFFALLVLGTFTFGDLLKDTGNLIFNKKIVIDIDSKISNEREVQKIINDFDQYSPKKIEDPVHS